MAFQTSYTFPVGTQLQNLVDPDVVFPGTDTNVNAYAVTVGYLNNQIGNISKISNGNSNISILANGNVTVTAAGNANIVTITGTGANITGTLSVTGISNLGPNGNVVITGGSNGQVLTTNGSGGLSWTTASGGNSSRISNGTSNVSIDSVNGNITVGANGVSNVVKVQSTQVSIGEYDGGGVSSEWTDQNPGLANGSSFYYYTSLTSLGSPGLFFATVGACTTSTGGSYTNQAAIVNVAANTSTNVTLPFTQSWSDAAYDGFGNIIVLVGKGVGSGTAASNVAARSTNYGNGNTFSNVTIVSGSGADSTYEWSSIAYGNGTFVALASGYGNSSSDSANFVVRSTDGGATWSPASTQPPVPLFSRTAYNGLAYGTPYTNTSGVFTTTPTFVAIAGHYPLYPVSGTSTTDVTTSVVYSIDNGNTWIQSTLPSGNVLALTSVSYGYGGFIAVGTTAGGRGAQEYWTSSDGAAWSKYDLPGNLTYENDSNGASYGTPLISYGSRGWLAVGGGNVAFVSSTGLSGTWQTWADVTGADDFPNAGNGRWAAGSDGSYYVLSAKPTNSSNGIIEVNQSGGISYVANLVVNGYVSVSSISTSAITSNGNVALSGANVSLGAVGNLHIGGGATGQVLTTDGSNSLSWASVTTNRISNGNSNVTVVANANVTISSTGNANIVVVTGTGVNVAGTLSVTGVSNLGPNGNVVITGGTNGQVLTTNGSGGLSWTTVSSGGVSSNIANGTSNVSIDTANGPITVGANGIPNVVSVSSDSVLIGEEAGTAEWSIQNPNISTLNYQYYSDMVSVGNGIFFAVVAGCSFVPFNPSTTTNIAAKVNVVANTSTNVTLPFTASWKSVATDGLGNVVAFVGGGAGGNYSASFSNIAARSSDGGNTFANSGSLGANRSWSSVKYGNGTFVAISLLTNQTTAANIVVRSTDGGSTWGNATIPPAISTSGAPFVDLAFGNVSGTNTFVAISGFASDYPQGWLGNTTTSSIAYSTDNGINWSAGTLPVGANAISLTKVAYGNGMFLAVGSGDGGGYTTDYWISTNGTSWTQQQFPDNVYGTVVVTYDATMGWLVAPPYAVASGVSSYVSTTGLTGSWSALQTANLNPIYTGYVSRWAAASGNGYYVISDVGSNGGSYAGGVLEVGAGSSGVGAGSNVNLTVYGSANILNGVTSNGNIAFTGPIVSLGTIGNIRIAGGSNGQVLTTNGNGNISFTNATGSPNVIVYGNSEVSIPTTNGNIIAKVNNAQVMEISLTTIAVGTFSGDGTQGGNAIAIGYEAGYNSQGGNAIAIGAGAGGSNVSGSQGDSAVAVGYHAGYTNQGQYSVAIGANSGVGNLANQAIAIGYQTGANSTPYSIYIGGSANGNAKANVVVLNGTGDTLSPSNAEAFYVNPVRNDTSNVTNVMYFNTTTKEITYGPTNANTIANGNSFMTIAASNGNITGNVTGTRAFKLSTSGLSFGGNAGSDTQGANSIYIGSNAGTTSTGVQSIGLGLFAGQTSQGNNAIAIGANAGTGTQAANSIAIGQYAGSANTTVNSIYIGQGAGANGGNLANVIVLNSTGGNLDPALGNGLYISSVRNDTNNVTNAVYYNITTKEITYGPGSGNPRYSITNVNSSTYQILTSDQVVTVSYSGAATLTLPAAASNTIGLVFNIKDILGTNRVGNIVTIAPSGSDTLDGGNLTIDSPYNNWTIVGLSATSWGVL